MTRDITTSSKEKDPKVCSYCGTPLSPNFYFCVNCSRPYKSGEDILPEVPPETLGLQSTIEKKAPQVKIVLWSYMAPILSLALLSNMFRGEINPKTLMLVAEVFMFGVTGVLLYKYKDSLLAQFKNPGFNSRYAYLGLLLLPFVLLINYYYHDLMIWISDINRDSVRLGNLSYSSLEKVLIICVFPAVTEEIAFRGIVQSSLVKVISPRTAVIIASALFAMVHFTPVSFPVLFIIGLLFGWVKYKTRSLYPGMLLHFLHNFFVIFFF